MKPIERSEPCGLVAETNLLALAKAGDRAAFERLLRQHQGAVRRQLLRLTQGNSALADDLGQEAWVMVWRQLPAFRGDAAFATWLYRVAYTSFLMHRRRVGADGTEATPSTEEEIADLSDPVLRLDINRAVGNLPEPERVAVIHCLQLGLSHTEAAEVLGMPVGSLKTRLERGRNRLREVLRAWETSS